MPQHKANRWRGAGPGCAHRASGLSATGAVPVFTGAGALPPVKVHWGYPDPSLADGGEAGKRRAFELTRQAIGYRMLQLLDLPLQSLDAAALAQALREIGRR